MPVEIGNINAPWQYELVDQPDLGINLATRPETMKKGQCINALNVYFKRGKVVIDTGYQAFGQAIVGTPRAAYQFFLTDNTSEYVLLTNSTLYRWSDAATEWQFAKGPQSTTLSANAASSATSISVTSISGFSDGDRIGVVLDDASMHMTTVDGAPSGSTITLADALPSAAASGNDVLEPPSFTGDDDIPVNLRTYTPNNWLIITNGVDNVQRYDGIDCVDIPNLPSSGNCQCRAIGIFGTYLLLINTTEGGTRHPQRVRRCDTADPTNWSTGNAGFNDLLDSEDWCIGFESLGPYGIIYKERSIARMQLVNTEDRVFHIEQGMITGEGIYNPDQVVNLGDEHIFKGVSNLYRYKGGFDLEPLGDAIYYKIFAVDGEFDPTYANRSFLIYVEELDETWIFYSKDGETWPKSMLRYSVAANSFSAREFTHAISGFGYFTKDDDVTWNDLDGSWEDQEFGWGSPILLANSPTTHLCSPTTDTVYEYDYLFSTDAGTGISFEYETMDFFNPHSDIRFDTLEFYGVGGSVLVEASTDEGQSWVTIETVDMDATPRKYRINKQIIAPRIRFRWSGTGSGFELWWYGFMFSLENENITQ